RLLLPGHQPDPGRHRPALGSRSPYRLPANRHITPATTGPDPIARSQPANAHDSISTSSSWFLRTAAKRSPGLGSGDQLSLCCMSGGVGGEEQCSPPLLGLTRRRLNLAWICLRDDLDTEFFVEPQDLRCFESFSRPDGRGMTRLWFVTVPEHALVAA